MVDSLEDSPNKNVLSLVVIVVSLQLCRRRRRHRRVGISP